MKKQSTEKSYSKNIKDLTPAERRRSEKQGEALKQKLKKSGHKVKVTYKHASDAERGIYTDRPPKPRPQPIVVNVDQFLKEFASLCAKYLNRVKKRDMLLAMCQLQDHCSLFSPLTADRIKNHLGRSA